MRVGEALGLRWCDVDLEDGVIDANHTLVYSKRQVNGCSSNIHTPKTASGMRKIPMLNFVREVFEQERSIQTQSGVRCAASVDGYTDFVFTNRYGEPQHYGTLNKALRRIFRDCNDDMLLHGKGEMVLIPYFACRNLRHTFYRTHV